MIRLRVLQVLRHQHPLLLISGVLIGVVLGLALTVIAWTDPTASPPSLNVSAPINVSSTVQLKTGGVNFATASGSRVGIGTGTPATKLDVEDGGNSVGIASFYSGGAQGSRGVNIVLNDNDSNDTFLEVGQGSGPTTISSSLFAVKGNGTVGIGTATPGSSYKLDVNGAINASGNIFGAFRGFRVNRATNQLIPPNIATKVQWNNETYDTNNEFDSTTNFRFQPTVSGYFHCSAHVTIDNINDTSAYIFLRKTGTDYDESANSVPGLNTGGNSVSTTVFLNGTTDYMEVWAQHNRGDSFSEPVLSGSWSGFSCYKLGN